MTKTWFRISSTFLKFLNLYTLLRTHKKTFHFMLFFKYFNDTWFLHTGQLQLLVHACHGMWCLNLENKLFKRLCRPRSKYLQLSQQLTLFNNTHFIIHMYSHCFWFIYSLYSFWPMVLQQRQYKLFGSRLCFIILQHSITVSQCRTEF